MSKLTQHTISRVAGPIAVDITDDVRDQHLAAIEAALLQAPAARVRRRRSRRAIVLAAAALVALPVGAAVASDNAVPGDVLYPVKMAVEPIVAVLGNDVRAEHRVEELDRIVQLDRPQPHMVEDAVDRATDAVRDLPASDPIRDRLDRILDRIRERESLQDQQSATNDSTDKATTTTTEPRTTTTDTDTETTTTTATDRQTDSTSTTTTTVGDRSRDG